MNDKNSTLDITILDRSYKVNCAEGEREELLHAVTYLNQKMNEIKEAGRIGQPERIAVMAALNIAHELLSTKVGSGFDFGHLKRRIDSMQLILDEVLEPQAKLL